MDVETTGLQFSYHKAFCFQFFDGENAEIIYEGEPAWREKVQHWLDRSAREGLRAWNSKFDFAFAEAAGFTLPPEDQWHDGMIDAYVLNERRSVALKAVANDMLGDGADALQKEVKAWLNAEGRRRRKITRLNLCPPTTPMFRATSWNRTRLKMCT